MHRIVVVRFNETEYEAAKVKFIETVNKSQCRPERLEVYSIAGTQENVSRLFKSWGDISPDHLDTTPLRKPTFFESHFPFNFERWFLSFVRELAYRVGVKKLLARQGGTVLFTVSKIIDVDDRGGEDEESSI